MTTSLPRGLVSHQPAAVSAGLRDADLHDDDTVDVETVARLWRVYAINSATMDPEHAAPRLENLLWRVWSRDTASSSDTQSQSRSRSRRSHGAVGGSISIISGTTLAKLFLRITSDGTASRSQPASTMAKTTVTTTTSSYSSAVQPQRNASGGGTGKPLAPILKKPRPRSGAGDGQPKTNNERVSFSSSSSSSSFSSSSFSYAVPAVPTATTSTVDAAVFSPPHQRQNQPQPGQRVIGSSPRKRTTFATSLASLGEEPSVQEQQQQQQQRHHQLDRASSLSTRSMRAQTRGSVYPEYRQYLTQETETWPFERSSPGHLRSSETGQRPTPEPARMMTSTARFRSNTAPTVNLRSKPGKKHGQHHHNNDTDNKQSPITPTPTSTPAIMQSGFSSKSTEDKQPRPQCQQRTLSAGRMTSPPSPSTTTTTRSIDTSLSPPPSSSMQQREHQQHQMPNQKQKPKQGQKQKQKPTQKQKQKQDTAPLASSTSGFASSPSASVPVSAASIPTPTFTPTTSASSLSSSRGPAPSQLSRLLESERDDGGVG